MISEESTHNPSPSDHQLLHIQLVDLDYMLRLREEELQELKYTAEHTKALQSRIEHHLYDIEQMQLHIGERQQRIHGAEKREAAMEEELLQTMRAEQSYHDIKIKYESTLAAIQDLKAELADTKGLYQQILQQQKKITELESRVEILQLDNGFLKEELDELRSGQADLEKEQEN